MSESKLIHKSDLYKLHDALHGAFEFLKYRDLMNGAVHLAKDCRYAPLTSNVDAALNRIKQLILECEQDIRP